jgi:hypothetical protein
MNYEDSIKRCENIICNFCGKKVRPIKNDKEKRFCHVKCGLEWERECAEEARKKYIEKLKQKRMETIANYTKFWKDKDFDEPSNIWKDCGYFGGL